MRARPWCSGGTPTHSTRSGARWPGDPMKPDRPALLVSLHDVSPLTLAECREAVALCADAGVPAAALTALVIPRHEDRAPLDEDEPTLAFVRGLAGAGAD